MTTKRKLTQSSLRALWSCEEKFRLRYLERLRARTESDALTLGKAVHKGIEVESAHEVDRLLLNEHGASTSEERREQIMKIRPIALAMISGALKKWTDWPERREVGFELPFRNPETGGMSTRHSFAGVWDGLWMEYGEDGEPALLEIKTTGRMDADYMRRLHLDWQISAYCHAATAALGRPVRQVVYRVIRKPSIRQRKTETPEEFADRVTADYQDRPEFYFSDTVVRRTEEELERWWWEAWETHRRILRLENGGMSIRNTAHCLDFKRCDYFDLCRGVVPVEAFEVLTNPNPELVSDPMKEKRS